MLTMWHDSHDVSVLELAAKLTWWSASPWRWGWTPAERANSRRTSSRWGTHHSSPEGWWSSHVCRDWSQRNLEEHSVSAQVEDSTYANKMARGGYLHWLTGSIISVLPVCICPQYCNQQGPWWGWQLVRQNPQWSCETEHHKTSELAALCFLYKNTTLLAIFSWRNALNVYCQRNFAVQLNHLNLEDKVEDQVPMVHTSNCG